MQKDNTAPFGIPFFRSTGQNYRCCGDATAQGDVRLVTSPQADHTAQANLNGGLIEQAKPLCRSHFPGAPQEQSQPHVARGKASDSDHRPG